ncbi:hypothetical protein BU17DRAFT_39287 [Hysterangium stoloniferum]|nr:hypothetical protein BU17DRAFT_39287 [Hysterangium stoloniferum]
MAKRGPIEAFFANYVRFDYDSSNSFPEEFERLAEARRWGRNGKPRAKAYRLLQTAATEQFNLIYGTNVNDINVWQSFCVLLQINLVPDTISACRKKVKGVFVNIVDLVDATISRKPINRFPSERALSEYTLNGRIFPLDRAKAGGVLRYLLRQISAPSGRGAKQRLR